MPRHEFRVIQGCPCPKLVAPYIAVVVDDAFAHRAATLTSCYRGDDARSILNAHGHHSQYQLVHATPSQRIAWQVEGTPNPVDHSTHELYSDGRAYPHIPDGHELDWWMEGFDVAAGDSPYVIAAGHRHGWDIFRPYDTEAEIHHLNFRVEPKPNSLLMRGRIIRLRLTLPRH